MYLLRVMSNLYEVRGEYSLINRPTNLWLTRISQRIHGECKHKLKFAVEGVFASQYRGHDIPSMGVSMWKGLPGARENHKHFQNVGSLRVCGREVLRDDGLGIHIKP